MARPGNGKIIKGTLPTEPGPGLYPAFSATGQDVFSDGFDHSEDGVVISAAGARSGKCFYATGQWRAIANTHVLLPRPGQTTARFLWYLVNDENFWIKGGTAQPFVKVFQSLDLEVPVPPIDEQNVIATVLDSVLELGSTRTRLAHFTRELPASAFDRMFGNRVEGSSTWPVVPLDELVRPKQWPTISRSQFTETGYPVFGANGQIGLYSSFNHAAPTVLVSCRGTCGDINISPPQTYVTGNAMALDNRDDTRVGLQFLAWALRVRGLEDTITGSSQPQITRTSLTRVALKVPPRERQQAFEELVAAIDAVSNAQLAAASQLEDLFNSARTKLVFS